jgi:endonuclease-3
MCSGDDGAQGVGSLARLRAQPARHIRAVDDALADAYGDPLWEPDGDPLGGLIATILSQNTSDVNSDRAYVRLRARFPTWEAVLHAAQDQLADAIRSGGLAQIKAARILEALATLHQRYGRLDLDWLSDLPVPEARAVLTGLHGVGAKTASCVLLFNLGKPAFPVDTHVHRLSRRIGFAGPKMSPAAVQDLVEASIAPERTYPLHVNLIRHGRQVCKALRPQCGSCQIRRLCRFGTERDLHIER